MAQIKVRLPTPEDAQAFARIWLDNARYYADLAPERFQVPNEDGLTEWMREWLEEPTAHDQLRLVAEGFEEVVVSL